MLVLSRLIPPLLVAALLLPGCGRKSFKNANDELRAERQQLQQRVTELETQLEHRLGEIASLRARLDADAAQLPGGEPPLLSTVKFDRYTGPVDTDGDGRDDVIRLYVRTLDQRGRMLPVAARAVVQMVRITPGTDPATYLERAWEPAEFDAAYRTGFTGTHYTLELPLDGAAPNELTVKLTLTAAAGETHTAEQAFRITTLAEASLHAEP